MDADEKTTTDETDWRVEPEWCSERLFDIEPFEGRVWDPFAGTGRIVRAAQAVGLHAFGSDKVDRNMCPGLVEFDFFSIKKPDEIDRPENIVSNPPWKYNEAAVVLALQIARRKVAMILSARFMLGARSMWLETTPLCAVLYLTPRPPMPPGDKMNDPKARVATNGDRDFAWYIWEQGYTGRPELGWCRRDSGRTGKG